MVLSRDLDFACLLRVTGLASDNLDFLDVTELSGNPISGEQLQRLAHRYLWATDFCRGKDVAEVACGTGPGLGLLAKVSASCEAGDFSAPMLDRVRGHYGERIPLRQFDATVMPYADASKDVLVIFEAIYYLQDIERFRDECSRVLRPGGYLLIATANKDLSDFNPSPHSHRYLGTTELENVFQALGEVSLFGFLDVGTTSVKARILRPVKSLAVRLGLMPKTMAGKRMLKRLVFGKPVRMPAEIDGTEIDYERPRELSAAEPDRRHKVIYCAVKRI